MEKIYENLFIIILALCSANFVSAQGLFIGSGTTLSLGASTLSLSGNWNNYGTFTSGSGTVIFNSSSRNQTITNSSGETFYNLTINKAADDVQLVNGITVTSTLTCISGDLDLNGNVLNLTGSLSETSGNTVKGSSGYITCSFDLNAPSSTNPHNIGIEITSSANLGATTIKRGHEPQSSSGNTGIKRYFEINPTNNSSLDAMFVFKYDESELNSIDESTYEMFNSEDNGSTWNECVGTLDVTNNTYTLSGINSFCRFTLASSSFPLPVELASFLASVVENAVALNWQTATEVNNYGFEVERARLHSQNWDFTATAWTKIAFVAGAGNSNSPKEYSFVDNSKLVGKYQYRLKQIDIDGNYKYSDIVEVNINSELPTKFELSQNYPNPFNPSTVIQYSLPVRQAGIPAVDAPSLAEGLQNVTLKIYDILGNEVTTLVNENQSAGNYEVTFNASGLASGVYLYKLQTSSGFISTKKLVLLK